MTEHILQACPKMKYSALREVIWPEETTLQSKLYAPRPKLERTAQFAMQTGLTKRSRRRKTLSKWTPVKSG
jgi:hypothetical protein